MPLASRQPGNEKGETTMKKTTETRVQNGILSGVESRILKWIVERLPQSIGPDHLTLLGLFAMVGAGVAYGFSGSRRPVEGAVP